MDQGNGGIAVIYLLIYSISSFGLAWIWGHSTISRPFREYLANEAQIIGWPGFFLDLIECPGCSGFWIGAAAGIVGLLFMDLSGILAIALPLYTAGSNVVIGKLTKIID